MSTNELNTTAKELLSIRSMIAELEAEAEALTDKLKAAMVERGTEALQGNGWKATWKNVVSSRFDSKRSRPTMQTYTASTASRPPQPASVWEYERGPHIPAEAQELAFVLARNDADFTRAMLMRALALEKAIYGQRRARA